MSGSRRLAQQVTTLLLQHGRSGRVISSSSSNSIIRPEMHRALHSFPSLGSSIKPGHHAVRSWPGGGGMCCPQLSGAAAHHAQHSSSQQQPAPLLAYRRSWRYTGGRHITPPVAAASAAAGFTASTPAHGPAAVDDDGPEGELHAVETAIRANALIFAAKLAVFFMSNSSAMLAEAVHSVVDIANQMLLRIGIKKAQRQPNEVHPYGYARDQFIWPLISAVGIFCCGAGVSFVHGVTGLFEAHREIGDLYWNFVVLGVSGVLESHSLYVAVDTLRRRAAQQGLSLLSYVKTGADPAAVAVMMEDGAAVAGLFIAGGCLALCQITGAVYWDAVGSIAVSALLGVVAIALIQRNRKWLIGKSMPKAQENQILEHLLNDHVIRTVSNIKSEELGVRQYRFQADIAFDGEELARRALDRCGRVRLFKALDAAIRRHDPHALDALLMQFAAVIVSTTGAEVDRMEREIMRLVPGTRWVDLETDRGKPARLSSAYAAAAAAANKELKQKQQQQAAAAADVDAQLAQLLPAVVRPVVQQPGVRQQQQQQQQQRPIRPLDSVSDADHLAELEEYPLGSLGSFASWDDVHENVPEWIRSFTPDGEVGSSSSSSSSGPTSPRLTGADASIVGGNYLSHEQMHAIEAVLVEGSEHETYTPFCNTMWEELQSQGASSSRGAAGEGPHSLPLGPPSPSAVSVGGGAGGTRASADGLQLSWELQERVPDAAEQQQLADWAASERRSWAAPGRQPAAAARKAATGGRGGAAAAGRERVAGSGSAAAAQVGIGPGSTQSFCDVMADKAQGQQQQAAAAAAAAGSGAEQQQLQPPPQLPQEEQWGQEHKRRTMQKLLDLEDSVLARDGDNSAYRPFCESMFESLHPDQPKSKRPGASAAAQQQQQQQQQEGLSSVEQQLQTDSDEFEPKQHSA